MPGTLFGDTTALACLGRGVSVQVEGEAEKEGEGERTAFKAPRAGTIQGGPSESSGNGQRWTG